MLKYCNNLEDLRDFPEDISLSIYERPAIAQMDSLFTHIMENEFSVSGFVSKNNALQDVQDLIADYVSYGKQSANAYAKWAEDMAYICCIFAHIQNSDKVSFWLGTKRGCKRYHIDYVPMRLLVTYAGAGTEWIPHEASNWNAYINGGSNDAICKDVEKINIINPWHVALFRGEEKGILHKTPENAIEQTSIFMRLDHAEYLKKTSA